MDDPEAIDRWEVHPDPVFPPEELATIHSWLLGALDDVIDDYDMEVEEHREEVAEQTLLEIQRFVSILTRIEKRINITPSLAYYHGRLDRVLGAEYLKAI